MSMSKGLDVVPSFHSERLDTCQSTSLACASSIRNNDVCDDLNPCQFLPEMSTLKSAWLTIDIACSDFSSAGKLIENIRLCPVPDCSVYGEHYVWDKQSVSCCWCNLGICSCRDFTCTNAVALTSPGPWIGCSERCNESMTVLKMFDVTSILCPNPDSCTLPSIYYQVVLAASVDKPCGLYLTTARLKLQVEYYFKWTYGAGAELPYFAGVDIRESSLVLGTPNVITIRLRLRKGITMRAGGLITLSGIYNSSQQSNSVMLESVVCSQDFLHCIASKDQPFPSIATYDPQSGSVFIGQSQQNLDDQTFHLQITLKNPSAKQSPIEISVTVQSVDGSWNISTAVANQRVFSGSDNPDCTGEVIQRYDDENQCNVFFCQVLCNFLVEKNSSLELKGLLSQHPSSGSILVTSLENGPYKSASWNRATESLILNVDRTYATNEPISAEFRLKNDYLDPVVMNTMTVVRVSLSTQEKISTGNIVEVMTAGDFALDTRLYVRNAYVKAFITESHQRKSEANELTCNIDLGINLIPGDQIMLHGLSGSQQPSTNSLIINFAHEILYGTWDNLAGSMSFFVTKIIPAGNPLAFSFSLQNPEIPSDPAQIYLSIATSRGIHLPFLFCFGSILALSSKSSAFIAASIVESSTVQNDLNRLTIRFSLNGTLPPKSNLIISGLDGAQTPNGTISVTSSENNEQIGHWNMGQLTILTASKISAGQIVSMTIEIINPAFPISKSRLIFFELPGISSQNFQLISDVLRAETSPAFSQAYVAESNSVPGAPNKIQLTAICNARLNNGSIISVSGLAGTSGLSGPITISGPGAKYISLSTFDAAQGVLSLHVRRAIESFQEFSIQFTLRNPFIRHQQSFPSVSASAKTPTGATFEVSAYRIPESILEAALVPSFVKLFVNESSRKVGHENQIEIMFQANFFLQLGLNITLSNLLGTQTPSRSDLSLSCNWQLVQRSWQNSGTLILTVMENIDPFEDVIIQFTLMNSKFPRPPVVPCISSDITPEILAITPQNYTWNDGIRLWSGDQDPLEGKGFLLGPNDDSIWYVAVIGESNQVAGQPNTLSVSLVPSVRISAYSTVVLSGLTGSEFEGTSVEIRGFKSVKFGAWTSSTGTLSFTLDEPLASAGSLVFHFTITNPAVNYPAVLPVVSVTDPNGTAYEGWPFRLSSSGTEPPCCLSAWDEPKFLQSTVRETLNVAGQPNLLNFSFLANTNLAVGMQLTISGLIGLQTPTNPYVPVSNRAGFFANWTQETGILVVSIDPIIYNCREFCGKLVEFSVCLRNRRLPASTGPSLFVSASYFGSYITSIGLTNIVGNVLRGDGEPKVVATVSESSKIADSVNTIFVRVKSNIEMSACYPRWLPGSAKWIDDSSGAEQSCPWRNGNKCLPVTNLLDGLLQTGIEMSVTGTKSISFNFQQLYRTDGIQVFVNRGASNARRIRFQYIPVPNISGWRDAGILNIVQSGAMSVLDFNYSIASQYWRVILDSTFDESGQYPFSSMQELQV